MPTLDPDRWRYDPIDWMDFAAHAIPVAVFVLVVVVWILETLFAKPLHRL